MADLVPEEWKLVPVEPTEAMAERAAKVAEERGKAERASAKEYQIEGTDDG